MQNAHRLPTVGVPGPDLVETRQKLGGNTVRRGRRDFGVDISVFVLIVNRLIRNKVRSEN